MRYGSSTGAATSRSTPTLAGGGVAGGSGRVGSSGGSSGGGGVDTNPGCPGCMNANRTRSGVGRQESATSKPTTGFARRFYAECAELQAASRLAYRRGTTERFGGRDRRVPSPEARVRAPPGRRLLRPVARSPPSSTRGHRQAGTGRLVERQLDLLPRALEVVARLSAVIVRALVVCSTIRAAARRAAVISSRGPARCHAPAFRAPAPSRPRACRRRRRCGRACSRSPRRPAFRPGQIPRLSRRP